MTKSELIEALNAIPGDPPVYVSSDPEGNTLMPAKYVEPETLTEIDGYIETVHLEDLVPADDGEIDPDNCFDAICLWP